METFLLRLWLPDRPGALGHVASRIGAVRGDVVGIEILERDGGQAIDELVVELPDPDLIDLLVDEVRQVEGVAVEEVGRAEGGHDPLLDSLEAVAQLTGADDLVDLYDGVAVRSRQITKAAWAVLIDTEPEGGEVAARSGDAPSGAWLRAFVSGSAGAATSRCDDVVWAPLPSSGMALVVGRDGPPFRARESHRLAALARVAGSRRRELSRRRSCADHPGGASAT